ncbi:MULTISPECIES: flagellar assembly protein H [unclassified Tychonema]|uniref:flagellar assembly protein H n=1 Tax=unclassified Tychonema TaxID=2642144 RepID=UPI001D14D119|nr:MULTISPECIES: flagellar assembly protein H [unclassified Tychonema]
MAATVAVIEPFRNPVNTEGIFSCVVKLLNSRAKLGRQTNREDQRLEERLLPRLWILTPTASELLLDSFGFWVPEESEGWGKGVYFLTEVWRVGLIAIHQLPRVPETMWLRMLGRGRVQQQAIAELSALPVDNPLRTNALQLLYVLQANLQANTPPIPAGDDEDQELVMAIAPLFQQHLEAAKQQGQEEGQRMILESFLQVRFGESDPLTLAFIPLISALPVAEFTVLLVQLSNLPAGQNEHQEVQNLLAQTVLEKFFIKSGKLEQLPVNLISNLLALSPDNLPSLLADLPQLSIEELTARLAKSFT